MVWEAWNLMHLLEQFDRCLHELRTLQQHGNLTLVRLFVLSLLVFQL